MKNKEKISVIFFGNLRNQGSEKVFSELSLKVKVRPPRKLVINEFLKAKNKTQKKGDDENFLNRNLFVKRWDSGVLLGAACSRFVRRLIWLLYLPNKGPPCLKSLLALRHGRRTTRRHVSIFETRADSSCQAHSPSMG